MLFSAGAADGYITCKILTADRQNYSWGIYRRVFAEKDFPQVSEESELQVVVSYNNDADAVSAAQQDKK